MVTRYSRGLSTSAHKENTKIGPPIRIHVAKRSRRVMKEDPSCRLSPGPLRGDGGRLGKNPVLHHGEYALRVAQYAEVSQWVAIDKQKVGQVAAEIRRWRKPEPYKGKGIAYRGEYIFRKEGKKR